MQEKTKNVLIAVLIVGLVSMTVAYAALSTTLTISSSAKVAATKWNIIIDNFAQAAAQPNGVSGTSEVTVTGPTSTSGTTISVLVVTFKKPGDVAKFTFNLKNTGDIDAQLNTFTLGEPASSTKVTKSVVCGSGTKVAPATATTNNSMDLAKTSGVISCEMTLTLANDATIPASETTVTIPDTVFLIPLHMELNAPDTTDLMVFRTVVNTVFIVFHTVVMTVFIAFSTVVITVLIALNTVVTMVL